MLFRRKRSGSNPQGSLKPQLSAPAGKGRRIGQAALFDRIVERIKQSPEGGHLVDVGCGSGVLSLRLLQASPGLRVTGVEPSTDLVRLATKAAAEAGLTARVRFARSDLRMLPVSDASAQLVVGAGLLTEASSPQSLLAEIRRVLVPGGSAILVELAEEIRESQDAFGGERAVLDEDQIKRLVSASPFKGHASIELLEVGQTAFREVTLTAPLPEAPRDRYRR